MYLKLNSGYDRAQTLYKLMSGTKPRDLVVKSPAVKNVPKQKPVKNDSYIASGLLLSMKNILEIASKGK